jgi:hypothetical protein
MSQHRNIVRSYSELLTIPQGDNEYAFYPNDYIPQWKIHLCLNRDEDIYPDLDEPLIRDVSRFLIEEKKINHKYANGGDGFKTYTIYSGSMEDTLDLALDMKKRFSFPQTDPDLEQSDLYLANGIYMRFEGQPEDSMFMRYGYHGIPMIKPSYNFGYHVMDEPPVLNKQDKILLHALAGHVFCAEHYGAHYLGKDYADTRWDKGIFERLGQNFSNEFVEKYVSAATQFGLHKYNHHLKTDDPVSLNIEDLVRSKTDDYHKNVKSIMDKWDKTPSLSPAPADDILSRYGSAKQNKNIHQHKINAITHKF